jgi:tetratricopeptide (TPR) repeat protein
VARLTVLGFTRNDLSNLYSATGNTQNALTNILEAKKIGESIDDQTLLSVVNMNVGNVYMNLNKLDSALLFAQKSLVYTDTSGFKKFKGYLLSLIGTIYFKKGNNVLAKKYYSDALLVSSEEKNFGDLGQATILLANLYSKTGERDSSLLYAKKGLQIFRSLGSPDGLVEAYTSLSSSYALRNNMDSAFIYQGLAMAAKDSLNNIEKINQFNNIGFDEQLRLQQVEQDKVQLQNSIRTYAMLSGILVFMVIAFLLYRNSRNRQKSNILLQHQKQEIEVQKENIEQTLSELKSTQAQLIQSEKMASLGELTTGIAHEIQNPLNFVNNFSEVNGN